MCLLKQYRNFISSVATPDLLKMRFIDTLEDAMISLFLQWYLMVNSNFLLNVGLIKDMNMGIVQAMIYQVIHRIGLFDIPIHIEYANSEKSLYVVFISCVNVLTNLVVNAHL